jgi:hypothetical protein
MVGIGIEVACVAGPQFYGGPDLQRAGYRLASRRLAFICKYWENPCVNKFIRMGNMNTRINSLPFAGVLQGV